VPLQQLEDMAPGTWYLNVLAAYPERRRRGHGRALLGIAERLAAAEGKRGVSMILSEANEGALRLYETAGYRFVSERPMVKEAWHNPGNAWVLLIKELAEQP